MDNDTILDLIKKHESGGRNIVNYMYGPGRTAQGYYQITDTNWKDYGPKAGVDVEKYPNARSAPEEDQRKVASHLLTQTPKGVRNWSDYNPKLKAALDMPQESQDQDFTLAELQAEKARRTTLKQVSMGQKSVLGGKITPPSDDRGFLEKFASFPDLGSYGMPGIAGSLASEVIPGVKQAIRGTAGYKPFDMPKEQEYSGPARAADIIEGSLRAASPMAIPGMIANPAGAMAGLGLGIMGNIGGSKGAEYLGADPDVQRLTGDITGLVTGGIGSKLGGPKAPPSGPTSPSGGGGSNLGYRSRALAKGIGGYRVGHMIDAILGPPKGPEGSVGPPPTKYPNPSWHEDNISNSLRGPERLQAHREMVESLVKQNYTQEDATRMADNAFRKAETADAEKAAAAQPKPEKPPKITYQQLDRNVAAAPAQGRMALKQRYIEVLTSQGMPPDIAEQHFNTAMVEARQNDLDLTRKADADEARKAANEGPSAKKIQDLKDMLASGTLPSEDYQAQMSRWLSPETIARDIAEGRQKWLGPPQQNVQFQPQRIPQNLQVQPQGPPQGLVQPPQGGFNQVLGQRAPGIEGLRQSLAAEPSNLTKFKVTSGPQEERAVYGPRPKPFAEPEPEPPIASTKLVDNASRALFKGNYDLDKLPTDNLDWRKQFRTDAKLSGVPTEKSVKEAIGIAKFLRAKAARGENVPGVKIGRNEKGQWVRVDAP